MFYETNILVHHGISKIQNFHQSQCQKIKLYIFKNIEVCFFIDPNQFISREIDENRTVYNLWRYNTFGGKSIYIYIGFGYKKLSYMQNSIMTFSFYLITILKKYPLIQNIIRRHEVGYGIYTKHNAGCEFEVQKCIKVLLKIQQKNKIQANNRTS